MGMLELLEDGPKMRKMPQVMDALLAEDKDQWITIHPNGEGDNRHIQIDDQTGEILKGGAVALQGTNIKDFSKNMKDKIEIEGKKFKTEEEYRKREEEIKNNFSKIRKLIDSGKKSDLDEAHKIMIDMGVFGEGGIADVSLLDSLKEQKPESYIKLIDTWVHHKVNDSEAEKLFNDYIEKFDSKYREAYNLFKKIKQAKESGRYNVVLKHIEENKEVLEHLHDYEQKHLSDLANWAKSRKK